MRSTSQAYRQVGESYWLPRVRRRAAELEAELAKLKREASRIARPCAEIRTFAWACRTRAAVPSLVFHIGGLSDHTRVFIVRPEEGQRQPTDPGRVTPDLVSPDLPSGGAVPGAPARRVKGNAFGEGQDSLRPVLHRGILFRAGCDDLGEAPHLTERENPQRKGALLVDER